MPTSKRKHDQIAAPPPPTCLPLHKFSHATVLQNSAGHLPWKHIVSQGDIFAVFETVRTLNADGTTKDSNRFKVLQDPNIMEDLDLDLLASESRRALDTARDASDHSKDHNVAVIKKVPVIAIKYPISGRQVKRFQIRFTTDADFYETLKQLANAGVHMLEAGTFPSNRPQTSQHSQQRDVAPFPQRSLAIGDSVFPNGFVLGTDGPAGAEMSSDLMPPPPVPYQSSTMQVKYNQQQMPSTQIRNHDISALGAVNCYETPWGPEQHTPVFRQMPAVQQQAPQTVPSMLSRPSAIDIYTPRPSTAPAKVSQHLSQMLPPKRELPFRRSSPRLPPPQDTLTTDMVERTCNSRPGNSETSVDEAETIIPDSQTSNNMASVKKKKPTTKATSKATGTKTPAAKVISRPSRQMRAAQPQIQNRAASKGVQTRNSHKQDLPPLPSMQNLLDGSKANDAHDRKENAIDTQALLSRAASTKRSAATKSRAKARDASIPPSDTRMTRSMSMAVGRDENPPEAAAHPSDSRPDRTVNAFPCTPAGQLINTNTPTTPAPAAAAGTISPRPSMSLSQPCSPAEQTSPQPRFPPAGAPQEAAPIRPPIPDDLTSILDTHPLFTDDCNEKLAPFSRLSPARQQHALEQWCVRMYRNPDFRVLCRALNASHRAQLALTL